MAQDESSKAWKFDTKSEAGMKVRDQSVQMNGSRDKFIHINDQGTFINGPISFVGNPKQNRVGGLWQPQSPFIQMFPSTIVSPIPQLLVSPPLGAIDTIVEGLNTFRKTLV